MKKLIYSLVALTLAISANAADVSKIYILGEVAINGVEPGWNLDTPASVDVIDGKATVNITNNWGKFTIYTATPDEVDKHEGYDNSWNVVNATRIAPASLGASKFGVAQQVVDNTDVVLPIYGGGNWTIEFTDNLTKATVTSEVWDGKIHCLGQGQTINNQEMGWWNIETPLTVDASEGYFTLECSYLRALTMSTSKSTNWGEFNVSAVGPEGFELIPGTESDPHYRVPLSVLGKEVKAVKSAFNIAPPYPGAYTIRIKDDLSTIEYKTAPRRVAVCGTFNNFSTDNGTWEMTSDDNITYTFTCDDAHQIKAGEKIRLFANSNWTYSWMYMTGESTEGAEISLGSDSQEWNFIGSGPSDGSVFAKDFTGTITAVIPAGDIYAENFYQGTKAQVTCTPSKVTGIIDAVEDCDTDAPVEYYTLQGIRINAPVEGLYIKRQGNKVSKILIK